jgi:hypothetical protein
MRAIQLLMLALFVGVMAHAETPKSCPAGKVLVQGKCFDPCPPGYQHDNQGKCTVCASGYEKNPKTGACEKASCPGGKIWILGKCFDPCPPGYQHDNQGKCTVCASGYEKNPKTQACVKKAS